MKKSLKALTLISLSALLFIYGCDKNPTSPQEEELTNTEQMVIIAAELAEPTGGISSDLNTAYDVATGDVGALYKTSSFDTTISVDWISYQLHLNFYSKNGSEQARFIPSLTDSVVFNGAASGHTSSETPTQDITLNRDSNFKIANIISYDVTMNGSASNNSSYKVTYSSSIFQIAPKSTFNFQNLKVNLANGNYIPYAGKIVATIKGHITKTGAGDDKDMDYSYKVTAEFIGGDNVKVTLPNGVEFTLNLRTGKFSLA
ncbi:MAG: hypothetical protein GXO74_03695 [Calditrichaeota bacterium]|nr:hypothetical protein [Calditrichota bacterium]